MAYFFGKNILYLFKKKVSKKICLTISATENFTFESINRVIENIFFEK